MKTNRNEIVFNRKVFLQKYNQRAKKLSNFSNNMLEIQLRFEEILINI